MSKQSPSLKPPSDMLDTKPEERAWKPIDSIPMESDAKFLVRNKPDAVPILVVYRKTRAYSEIAMRFMPFFKMVDAKTGLNLPKTFKPTEWSEA